MREDVKQKHFSTPLRETSIGACIQAPLLRGEDFDFNAWRATQYDRGGSQLRVCLGGFMPRSRHHSLRSCASQPLAKVPTIILCEARGLWLFWVVRGGIGLTRRLGADSSTRTPNERLDTLPRTRASPEPMVHHRGVKPGRPPEFCATLKLLVASVVRRRNVPPSSRVSKQ